MSLHRYDISDESVASQVQGRPLVTPSIAQGQNVFKTWLRMERETPIQYASHPFAHLPSGEQVRQPGGVEQ